MKLLIIIFLALIPLEVGIASDLPTPEKEECTRSEEVMEFLKNGGDLELVAMICTEAK